MISLLRTNLLNLLKSSGFWISIIFITFFLSFAPSAFGSTITADDNINGWKELSKTLSSEVVSAIIITGLLITVITTFGDSYVKIKNSLIYQNTLLNSKPKYQFYVATIIPVIFYTSLTFGYSLILSTIFDSFKLLNSNGSVIKWGNIQIGWLLWSIVWTIILGISIALMISTFTKNLSIYTSITWAYLFLILFFGGASVPIFLIRGGNALNAFMYISFAIPNTFSNFLFVNAFNGSIEYSALDILDIVMPVVISIAFIVVKIIFGK